MFNNLHTPNIRVFVFGTLRKGGRLDFYMEGSKFQGMCYTQGQLMKSEIGSAYIDFAPFWPYTKGETCGFSDEKKSTALFYRRRNDPVKIHCGDWINRKKPVESIEQFLVGERNKNLGQNDIIKHITEYLNY